VNRGNVDGESEGRVLTRGVNSRGSSGKEAVKVIVVSNETRPDPRPRFGCFLEGVNAVSQWRRDW
jgi:hypothetical protein